MKKHLASILSVAVALATAALQPLPAQDTDPVQASATKAFAERQESSVKLTVTRKLKAKDHTFELSALSLDGKGLLVASLRGIEASGRGGGMHLQLGGPGGGGEEGGAGSAKGELTRVALLRADATEAEADLVMTDPALDLALIRVRPGEGGAVSVPPAPPVAKAAPALLQDALAIERQGPAFQRIATAALLQIAAVVETPRRLYIPSEAFPGGLAVYNLAGELLGVLTTVRNQSVIVPAEAILKLAASAPAKAGE